MPSHTQETEIREELVAKIMDWHYEVCAINFDAEAYAQDATGVIDIVDEFLSSQTKSIREEVEGLLEKIEARENKRMKTAQAYHRPFDASTLADIKVIRDVLSILNKEI